MERKFKIKVDGREYSVTVEELTEIAALPLAEPPSTFQRQAATVAPIPTFASDPGPIPGAVQVQAAPGDVVSTLGGVVESLLVTPGQEVREGDRVIVIEAMKMKTPITASKSGRVEDILVNVGDGVQTGQVLIKLA